MALNIFRIQGVIDILAGKARQELQDFVKAGKDTSDELSRGAKLIQTAYRTAVGAAATAIVGLFATVSKEIAQFAVESDTALKQFQVQTVASADEVERFSQNIANLRKVNTDSTAAIGKTLTQMRREFGDTGAATERLTQDMLDFAKVTGQDNAQAVSRVANVMRAWKLEAEDSVQVTDILTKAWQETGVSIESLTNNLSRSAPTLQTLGLSMERASALTSLFVKQGLSAESAMTGLRNVVVSATAPTDKIAEAMRTLGINMDAANRPIGGAGALLDQLIDKLGEGTLTQQEYSAALEILGRRAGVDFVRGISAGAEELQKLNDSLEDSVDQTQKASDTWDQQIGEKATLIFRDTFGDAIAFVGKLLGGLIHTILDFVDTTVDRMQIAGQAFGATFYGLEVVLSTAGDAFTSFFKIVATEIGDFIDAIITQLDALPAPIKERLGLLNDGLKDSRDALKSFAGDNAWEEGAQNAQRFATALDDVLSGDILTRNVDLSEILGGGSSAEKTREPLKAAAEGLDDIADAALSAEEQQAALNDEIEAQVKAVEHLNHVRKISDTEAANQIQAILDKNRELIKDQDLLYSLEERIFDLRDNAAQEAKSSREKREKDAEDARKKREQEAEQEQRLQEQRAEEAHRVQAEIIKVNQGETAAKLFELNKQRDDLLKNGQDRILVEEFFQTQRKKIIEDSNKDIEKKQQDHVDNLKKIQDQLSIDILNLQDKPREAELAGLKQKVQELRKAGVDEVSIREYVHSVEKKLLQDIQDERQKELDLIKKKKDETADTGFDFTFGGVTTDPNAKDSTFGQTGLLDRRKSVFGPKAGSEEDLDESGVSAGVASILAEGPAAPMAAGKTSAKEAFSLDAVGQSVDPNSLAPPSTPGKPVKTSTAGTSASPSQNNVAMKSEQTVNVRILMGGQVEVLNGQLSQGTLQNMLGDLGFYASALGGRPTQNGKGNA